jgi:hypothetical protein
VTRAAARVEPRHLAVLSLSTDEEGGRQISRDGHVREPVRERRVEDDLQPIDRHHAPVDISKPCGVYIQLFEARIRVAETRVPIATITVAKKCRPGPTLFQPNSITPRNPASRKKAVNTSYARSGPVMLPANAKK